MICEKCACEDFNVLTVYRNKVRRNGSWVYADNDTRIVLCVECGERYFSETKLQSVIKFNMNTMKKYEKNLDNGKEYEL